MDTIIENKNAISSALTVLIGGTAIIFAAAFTMMAISGNGFGIKVFAVDALLCTLALSVIIKKVH